MALIIGDDTMSSDRTSHTARLTPGANHQWEVSWLPGRPLDRNSAITAMILADVTADSDMHTGHRLWVHVEGWAAELGLTTSDALTRTSSPPAGKSPQLADPEAAG